MKAVQIVFAVFAILVSTQFSQAQYSRTVSHNNITSELKQKVTYSVLALKAEGYKIGDTYSASIKEGQTRTYYRDCYRGNEYVVIAVSEGGVYDLDINLSNSFGKQIAKDEEVDDKGVAMTRKYLTYNTRMKIQVENYESYNSRAYYDTVIIVAYK